MKVEMTFDEWWANLPIDNAHLRTPLKEEYRLAWHAAMEQANIRSEKDADPL